VKTSHSQLANLIWKVTEAKDSASRTLGVIDQQVSFLNEHKQALITAAVTGQIDVTTARGM
jgi:type I restriction enzyme S subunit